MKKQMLFLVVALFAVTAAFGQKNTVTNAWIAPTCGGTEYSPSIGVEYTYSVSIAGPGYNGDGTYTWRVTDDPTDLIAGASAPAADFTVTAGSGGVTNNDIKIVWNASSVGGTYFVVVNYREENSTETDCEINNVKVYQVQPLNGFWLDINASTDGTVGNQAVASATDPFNVCAPDVLSAIITTAGTQTTARVTYEYNTTTLHSVIHAAGYTGNFAATLTVAGLTGDQTATVTGWTAGAVDANGNGPYTTTLASLATGADLPVAVVINNHQYEGLADLPVTITIDGTYTDGTIIYKDKYNGATDCIDQPDTYDYITQTIKARPTVNPTNPANFVTPEP